MRFRPALAVALAVTAGACDPLGAPAARHRAAPPGASANERPTPPGPPERATGAAGDPIAAIDAFATAYINWTADTVSAQMSALASQSVGQARSAMQLAAAETGHDYELQGGGVANTGTVEAVAPLLGHRDQYVVVTREQTTATATTAYQGLRPAWHLALATVVETAPGQWVVSAWQPQS